MEREPGWTRAALAGDPRGKRAAAALSRAGSRAGAAGPRSGAFVPRAEEVLLKGQLLEGPEGVPSPPEHPRVAAGDLRRAVPPGCSVSPPIPSGKVARTQGAWGIPDFFMPFRFW